MPACFKAHRDHGVTPMRFEPACFRHGRCRRHDLRARRLHAIEQIFIWQSEMKTHDLGFEFLHDRAEVAVERVTGCGGRRHFGIESIFNVVLRETRAPRHAARCIRLRRNMTEEIDVDRGARFRPDQRDAVTRLLHVE